MTTRRRFTALAAASLLAPRLAFAADDWPSRPVNIIVPFAPGGATDIVARLLAEELRAKFGQPFVVENRTGAAGNIGVEAVVRSPANGYTLLFATMGSLTTNPHLYTDAKFNVERDLVPISQTFKVDHILVVNPRLPVKSVADLVAYAKANPKKVTYGSAGVGSSVQMFAVLLEMRTGVELTHVPYKGSAPALNDVVAGHIDMLMDSVPTSLPQIEVGNTRPLAVTSGTRNKRLANVPTMMEAGVPDYDTAAWGSLMAPAGTPPDIVAKLSAAVQEAYRKPQLQKEFADRGVEAVASTPQQLAALIKRDTELWGQVVKAGKVTLN
jgi:tripartite-type tricarboxylate transporter receptor subunit TctC